MSSTTMSDADIVRAGFESFGRGDLAAFAELFHPDATWNHRNDDRLGGIHQGREGVLAFVAESGRLSNGTLRAVPEGMLDDGNGRVGMLTHVSASRPDGRTLDEHQILLFHVEDGHVRSVDQYIGNPAAARAFWA